MVPECNYDVQDFEVEKVVIHEWYNKPDLYKNDIAIIKFKRAVVKNSMYIYSK